MSALLEIAPGLYQARRRLSASVFVLAGPRVAIIDGGLRGSHGQVLRWLQELGRHPDEIDHLIATHCHTDHVGGFARLRALSQAQVAVHEEEAGVLDGTLPTPNPFQPPVLAWLTGPILRNSFPPAAVDIRLKDGDTLNGLEVVHTPGHTAGSISLHLRDQGVLIVGDALEYRRSRLGLPNPFFTSDMPSARASIRRLAGLDFETLCFSHFPPIRHNAQRALRAFADTLDRFP